ncbi:MAG TPA: Ig domain-containing protein [Desulfuromonadales bacterium]|nr:Ig domain-containing protein [Desulfuromonadales bacterium]
MKGFCLLAIMLLAGLLGCSNDEAADRARSREPDWDKLTAADRRQPGQNQTAPEAATAPADNPAAGVAVGDAAEPATTVPAVQGTRFDLVAEPENFYLEVTPSFAGDPTEVATVEVEWFVNGEAYPYAAELRLPAEAFRKGDRIHAVLTPVDDFANSGEPFSSRPITVPNLPPYFVSRPPEAFKDYEFTYQVEATDPDDTEISFALEDPPTGMTISDEGLLRWSVADVPPGDYPVMIVATDPAGSSGRQSFTLTLQERETPTEQ